MTIESLVSRNDYIGTGGVSVYAYGFKIIEDTDLLVTVQDGTTGVESTLTLGLDYSVSGEGEESGGDVTLSENLASGDLLTIRRVRPLLQGTDIETQGVSDPSVLEDTFDSLMMICQQQQDEINRSLRLPETEADLYELPTATQRANKFLAFDADGEPIASDGGVNSIPVSAFMETVLDDVSAASARTTLDVPSNTELTAAIAAAIAAYNGKTGDVKMWASASIPSGWLSCDGSAISRTTYADLFALIGTTFGVGNGSTTFNIPDFKGRSPIGVGQGLTAEGGGTGTARTLGEKVGAETHTLTTTQMPAHSHSERGNPSSIYNSPGTGAFPCLAASGTTTTGSAGSSGSHNNMGPVLGINFIIKT